MSAKPKADIQPIILMTAPENLRARTTPELLADLGQAVIDTASHLERLASIVRELEERGEDLSRLKIGLLHHLRLIAHGQLLPGAVVRFGDARLLLDRVASLPLPDQRRLTDGEPVALWFAAADGSPDHRLADPRLLTRRQMVQVFARGHIRDQREQMLLLDEQRHAARTPKRERVGDMVVDHERGGVLLGRKFVPLDDLAKALKALKG